MCVQKMLCRTAKDDVDLRSMLLQIASSSECVHEYIVSKMCITTVYV